jgi:hypothetical protein
MRRFSLPPRNAQRENFELQGTWTADDDLDNIAVEATAGCVNRLQAGLGAML